MASLEVGAHYENAFSIPASTTKTSVLTCPAGHWYYVDRMNFCASDGSAGTADIIHYVAANTTEYTLKKAAVIPAADSYTWVDVGTVLQPGDILKVTPSRANQHVRIFYMVSRKGDPKSARLL